MLGVGIPHDQGTDAAKTDYYTNASGYHVPGVHTHLSDLLYCQWVYVPGVHTHKLPGDHVPGVHTPTKLSIAGGIMGRKCMHAQ